MNLLARFDPGEPASRLALGALVQVTVVIVLAGLVASVALRRRAAARHGLWLGALALVFLSPAIVVVADHAGLTLGVVRLRFLGSPEAGAVERTGAIREPADPVMAQEQARAAHPALPDSRRWRASLVGGLSALWVAGVLIGLGRLVEGWRRLARLRRAVRPFDDQRHGATLARVRQALALRRYRRS